ncbi:DUF3352 domain-containing protein, partial [bacterium]|nr:DUF3352 domain-containing protein [bacterium]
MRMLNFAKSLAVASLFTVFTFMATGCFGPAKVNLSNNEKSAQGVAIENYLPQDTIMMGSISTQDKNQRENLQKLLGYFPKEEAKTLWESLTKELGPKLKEANITYEDDLAPLFDDNFRITLGLKEDKQTTYIAFTLADTKKANALIEKTLNKDNKESLTKGEAFGSTIIDDEKGKIYMALYKDTFLLTNSKESRDSALKRIVKNEPSILSDKNFKEAYNRLPKPNLGIGYINMKQLLNIMYDSKKGQPLNKNQLANTVLGEAFALTAEQDGLRINASVSFDKNAKEFTSFKYIKPYMYKKIPGEKLIMYSESAGLKDIINLEMELLGKEKDVKENFAEMKETLKKTFNLDFDNDILSWMDKGFALVIQQNDMIIPAISVYIDASSNPEGAKKVLSLIDNGMQQAVESMLQNAPEGLDATKIIKKDTVKFGNSSINRVSFDVTGLSDEELLNAGLPSGIFVKPVEIYYGLTDDDYFLFSTYSGLDMDFTNTKTVMNNEIIKDAGKYIKDYEYQLSYISLDKAISYADNFIGYMQKIQGPNENIENGFNKVKKYLSPIKYIVSGNKKLDKNVAEGTLFVKIDQPEPVSSEDN